MSMLLLMWSPVAMLLVLVTIMTALCCGGGAEHAGLPWIGPDASSRRCAPCKPRYAYAHYVHTTHMVHCGYVADTWLVWVG